MIYIIDVVLTQEFLFTILQYRHNYKMGRHGCDRMVVGFTTTYMYRISAYHHWYEFESRSGRGVQHYVIKFVSDLPQVGWFSPGPMVSSKLNWPPRYNWNNVFDSGIKHHQTNKQYKAKQINIQLLLQFILNNNCTVHIIKCKFYFDQ
jgi:hypothetical protein